MRSIIIPNCSYDVFKQIRHAILTTQAHGLMSSTFDEDTAYFNFWDSQYVPEPLMIYTSNDQRDNTTKLENIKLPSIE